MKLLLVALSGLALAGPALAAKSSMKLAEEKQCFQCHAMDKDTIGPSFHTIKDIYKGKKHAERQIMDMMRMGSNSNLGPHWGKARMPDDSERPKISDREARQLARWILTLPEQK